jgi:hypothetical protein
MFARAMTARALRPRPVAPLAAGALALALALAGCGGGERQDANEPEGEFRVDVVDASFPAEQSIAEQASMKIRVQNGGSETVPNVAVTVETQPREKGGAASAFSQRVSDPRLADPNRPVWVLDDAPKGGTSAYANTWALGRLAPNQSKTFEWKLTAVEAGRYTVGYRVAPGLNGKAKLADGAKATGSFTVTISDEPVPARVNDKGEVVRGEEAGGGGSD